jgi:regulator of sigma E protease
LSVDGKPVSKFGGMGDSVTWRIVRSEGDVVPVKVARVENGQTNILTFNPAPTKEPTKIWERKSLRKIQIAPAYDLIVGDLATNGPAMCAGVKNGDVIKTVNSIKFYNLNGLEDYVESHTNETMVLSCERKGQPLEIKVNPEVPLSPPDAKASLGILSWEDKWTLSHPGAIEQVTASVNAMLDTFGALFARHSDIKPQHLGGAVKIMDVYARLFSSEEGWRLALWFSVLMNVNLALLNMLPIPVLDGGHILLAIIEGIRRKPISHRVVSVIQTGCAAALIMFMVYIAFYDVQDLPWKRGKDKDKPADIRFAPKPAKN